MEHQNNSMRNQKKSRTRKRIRYGSVCIALCLLIAGAAFSAANLLKGGKAPPPPDNETVSSNEGFFQEDRGQNEEVSPIPGPVNSVDSISVDVAAKNIVVMNADKVDALQQQKEDRLAQADAIGGFMFALSEQGCELTEFDEPLWISMVQKATVYHDGRLVFTFQNGIKIEA